MAKTLNNSQHATNIKLKLFIIQINRIINLSMSRKSNGPYFFSKARE